MSLRNQMRLHMIFAFLLSLLVFIFATGVAVYSFPVKHGMGTLLAFCLWVFSLVISFSGLITLSNIQFLYHDIVFSRSKVMKLFVGIIVTSILITVLVFCSNMISNVVKIEVMSFGVYIVVNCISSLVLVSKS